ncbi:unnamed protein product [Schistosoma margrebowiei]|uniref:Uncharacterized protein n=1 Tax=Schistosoma margrebowiei TaxID=48269 RepID=A0A183LMU6_9TREM|nr:unnamed protein product [Schistosoma margrebowiei]
MDTSEKCSRNSIDEDGEKLFTIGITEKHTEYAKVETDRTDITKQNEYTGINHEKVENQRDETTKNASGKQEKDEGQKKQQEEITKRKQTKIMEENNEGEDSKNIENHRENTPPKPENTNSELKETIHHDHQNQNKTPTELTEKIDELDSAQKFDVPLVACMSASKAHLDPMTDQPPVVELSQTSDNLTDHIDTEHLNDQLNTSPDNTNPTDLNDEINEVNSAPNSESTIVPSHISPMLGHTSETSITTIRSDTITEGRSDEDHELPETSHQDLQNQNKTPTELTEKIDELDSAQKFDVPLVACMSASKAHLDPMTDQPPVVELSQTSDNLTDHIDTEHLNDQLNTSPDNTNPTDLNDEINEVNSAPNSESTIVPSHISPLLVTNSDIVNSLFPDTNNSYVGLSDILANENNVAVLPNVAISVSDSTSTVLVDAGYSENISSNGNSILSEDFSKTVTSPTNEGITSRASSAINSPLSIQKSLESIKVHSRLKPSSYTNTTIQKNNSLPPSPKLLQKPTVKQNISGSQRSPTMTGPNFGQTNNLTNTKTKYASSTSANASPNLIRKPLSSLSKNTDSKK